MAAAAMDDAHADANADSAKKAAEAENQNLGVGLIGGYRGLGIYQALARAGPSSPISSASQAAEVTAECDAVENGSSTPRPLFTGTDLPSSSNGSSTPRPLFTGTDLPSSSVIADDPFADEAVAQTNTAGTAGMDADADAANVPASCSTQPSPREFSKQVTQTSTAGNADMDADADAANVPASSSTQPSPREVSNDELWRRNVGDSRRREKWKNLLLGGINLQAKTPQDCFENLVETASPYDSAIKRDVNRTLPQEVLFQEKNGKGQQSLFRLLRALALRLWDVGYCQSLNFVVATLISVFPDDESAAFDCALALLLRHSLVDLFRPKFPKLGVVIWQFDRIVEGFLPKVHAQLQRHGVNAEYYAIQWFLTLFASDLDQVTVRRIWDRFLVAGWQVVVQVSLALLYKIQDTLPTLDVCEALAFLRKFTRATSHDTDELLALADSFEVTHQMLSAVEAAYDWQGDVQLLVVKDLNGGEVHWAVQSVPNKTPTAPPCDDGDEEQFMPIPRAFSRSTENGGSASSCSQVNAGGGGAKANPFDAGKTANGSVQPFLIRDLDSGKTEVMGQAWIQYMRMQEYNAKGQAVPSRSDGFAAVAGGSLVAPQSVRQAVAGTAASAAPKRQPSNVGSSAATTPPASAGVMGCNGGRASTRQPAQAARHVASQHGGPQQFAAISGGSSAGAAGGAGGETWMQSVQRQAERRLNQV